jgi:hypothetical protein
MACSTALATSPGLLVSAALEKTVTIFKLTEIATTGANEGRGQGQIPIE